MKAQTLDTYQWKKHLDNETLTYYQKRDSAEQFFSQHDSLREIRKYGYKDFLRWSFYWSNRLDVNGYTIDLPKKLDSLLDNNASAFQNKSNSSNLEPWVPIGLSKKPNERLGGIGMVFCLEINPLNNNIILAGTPNGGIWRTDNLGQSWRPLKFMIETSSGNYDIGLIGVMSIKIDPNDTSRIYIGTGSRELQTGYTHKYSYGVLYSYNSGATWKRSGLSPNLYDQVNIKDITIVGNANPSNVIIHALSDNKIHTSYDGGVTFSTYDAASNISGVLGFYKIEALPVDNNIVIASGNGLFISYDSGQNWENITNELNSSISYYTAISITCNNALEHNIRILARQGNSYNLYNMNLENPNNIVVNLISNINNSVPSNFRLQSFLELAIPENNTNELYFGSIDYGYSSNSGLNIIKKNTSMHDDVRDIKVKSIGANNYIYVAHDAGIDLSVDNGVTYQFIANGIQASNFYNLSISENDPNLIIGGVHDSGTNIKEFDAWTANVGGDGFGQTLIIEDDHQKEGTVAFTNANDMRVKLVSNLKSFDAGSLGTTMCRFIDKAKSGNTVLVYYIDIVRNGQPNNVIYKSSNKGDSWTTHSYTGIPNHLEFSSFEVSDDNQVWIIGTWGKNLSTNNYDASLYISSNAGLTFSKLSYPGTSGIVDIEINKNGGTYDIWVTKGGFSWDGDRVWHTNDLGNTWSKLGNNTLGEYPVNTIAFDNVNNMLFAGTDRGVYYFDNSNNTWYEYNSGLPKCIIMKLVISYSNNKLRAATFGRGVWETNLKQCVFYTGAPQYIEEGTVTYSAETRANKNIIILSGATLVITGKLIMPNNSSITINTGGKLVVDGGVITNYCGGMWNGIVVEGTALLGQSSFNHGWCEVKNEGIIENARIAIKSNNGGVVRVIGGKFINNRFGVFFGKYSLAKNQIHTNYSVIANSNFKCYRAMIDKSYIDDGKYEGSKYFVGIAQQSGVRIINNDFESTYHPRADLKGSGIVTWGSRTYIHNNDFSGLTYGIEAAGFQNPLQSNSIYGNDFTDVSLAITETAQAGSQIRENTIVLPAYESNTWLMENYGIKQDVSRGFNVSNNLIRVPSLISNANTYGILVKNSATIPCIIEHNFFRKLEFANQLEGDNNVIGIQCNQYNQSTQDWSINPVTVGVIHDFGLTMQPEVQAANFFPDGLTEYNNIRINENMSLQYNSVSSPDTAIPIYVTPINVTVNAVAGSEYNEECETPFDPCGGNPIPCVAYAQDLVNNNTEASAEIIFKYKLNLAQQFRDSGMIEELRVLIEAETASEWEELKLPIYIEYGEDMNINPQDLINNLPSGEYKDFMQLVLDINNETLPIDSLGDIGLTEDIFEIAEGSSSISAAARKILEIFYGYQYVREAERWAESSRIRNNNTGTTKSLANQEEAEKNDSQKENKDIKQVIKPDFLLIPNPSNGNFVIKLGPSASGLINIIDMHGKIVKEVSVEENGELRIEKGAFDPGVYTIRLLNGAESYQLNKRIIILE
jgi:photosystem II stability/assembly factor-like uncharacterized protein